MDHVLVQVFSLVLQPAAITGMLVFLYWLIVCKLIKGITSENDEPEDY